MNLTYTYKFRSQHVNGLFLLPGLSTTGKGPAAEPRKLSSDEKGGQSLKSPCLTVLQFLILILMYQYSLISRSPFPHIDRIHLHDFY